MPCLTINGQYLLAKQLGKGSFGEIYYGIDLKLPKNHPDKVVAIKLELKSSSAPQLLSNESRLYKYLQSDNYNQNQDGRHGIPKLYWSGQQDDYNVMVIEMLGPNLENLLDRCGHKFTLKTTLILAQDILRRIHYLHSKRIIHRDLKPENFLIGNQNNNLYLIDYGLCKLYKNAQGQHIPENHNKKLIGTIRYASLNAHIGHELSRRDDLESIGYILIYFMKGKLPWQGIGDASLSKAKKYQLIYECKAKTSIEQLCQGLPKCFKDYMDRVKALRFDEKPDYNALYNLFTQCYTTEGYTYDGQMDW
jgi:serine/threonine protein kinase